MREFLFRLQADDRERHVGTDAGGREVLRREGAGVHRDDADASARRQHAVDERHQQQARREHGHADGARQLLLVLDEEAAARRDRADALTLELLRALHERGQQSLGATPHDEIGIGAGHAPIADGKRKRPRVADVADDARKARVEQENADGVAVQSFLQDGSDPVGFIR